MMSPALAISLAVVTFAMLAGFEQKRMTDAALQRLGSDIHWKG